jgi:F-type H+-transporting ATPase subunit delta
MSAVAKRYAKALFEVARDQDQLSAMEEELQHVRQIMDTNPELVKFLSHPKVAKEEKVNQLKVIFQDQISTTMIRFLELLIERNREEHLADIVNSYTRFANVERGLEDATVTSIQPLTDEDKQNLAEHFGQLINKKIRIHNEVDPGILGGLIVKIGDRLYDGSVSGKLHRFKRRVETSKS